MNENSKFKKFIAKIKSIKHIEIIIAIIAVLIMLLLYFSTKISFGKPKVEASETTQNYCERMQLQLTETLSAMKGVGKTKIAINWESSVEQILASITNNNGNSSSSAPQIVQSGGSSKPIVIKEIYPKAVGVIIICQGGDDVKTKVSIMTAVSVLLNITQDKIFVYAMNK